MRETGARASQVVGRQLVDAGASRSGAPPGSRETGWGGAHYRLSQQICHPPMEEEISPMLIEEG
jgi:hypothetical protein